MTVKADSPLIVEPQKESESMQTVFFIDDKQSQQFESFGLKAYKSAVYSYGLDLFHEARSISGQRDKKQSTIQIASQDVNQATVTLDLRRAQKRNSGNWWLKIITSLAGIATGIFGTLAISEPSEIHVFLFVVAVLVFTGAIIVQYNKELSV